MQPKKIAICEGSQDTAKTLQAFLLQKFTGAQAVRAHTWQDAKALAEDLRHNKVDLFVINSNLQPHKKAENRLMGTLRLIREQSVPWNPVTIYVGPLEIGDDNKRYLGHRLIDGFASSDPASIAIAITQARDT